MKKIKFFTALLFFALPLLAIAQIGLGNENPDKSSILDVVSTSKGILTPRMSTIDRDAIINPAKGLLIFNTTTLDFNYFDVRWNDFSKAQKSIFSMNEISTKSEVNIKVPNMKLEPDPGTYLVSFNGEYTNKITETIQVSTLECNTDLVAVYNQLYNMSITNSDHSFIFGNAIGETVAPGKYEVGSAMTVQLNLILDGGGNQNSMFIFHAVGDITFSSFTTVILTNGAKAENIFWVSEGAVNVGEGSTVKGTLLSNGFAVAVGALCVVEGRMFSTAGAIAFGPGAVSIPIDLPDTIDLKSLASFVVYTSAGAINNTGTTTVYNGNLASHAGDTGSLAAAVVNGIIYPTGISTSVVSSGESSMVTYVTFGIYKNGVLVPESSRRVTCDSDIGTVLLQAAVTVSNGDSIDVRWKTEGGLLALGTRSLILIKAK